MQANRKIINITNPGCSVAVSPLKADELIPDIALRQLARHQPCRDQGALSEEDQAILSMYLPDLCGELLALRALHRRGRL